MSTLTPLIASHELFTTGDVDCVLRRHGDFTRRTRDRLLAGLCASGAIVRVRRGLYARTAPTGSVPDPYHVAAHLAPDAVLAVGTALEVRGVLPATGDRCTFFTRLATAGPGPVWHGITLCPISHPTALVRAGVPFTETELVDGNGSGPLRVSTTERAFVDVLERPRLTGSWPAVLRVVDAMPPLDLDRVVCYLQYLDNATTAAKAGWILERYQEQFGVTSDVLRRIERLRPRGPHYLSRTRRESGRYVARWNLVVPPTV